MKDSGWKVILGTVIAGLLLFGWLNIVMASSVGPNDCSGTANSSAAESPWSDDDWEAAAKSVETAPACIDNGTYTHVSSNSFDPGDQTYVLYVKDFGFSVSGTIDGITVTLNTWSSSSGHSIDLCQLLDADGVRGGTNLCSSPHAIDSSLNTNVETLGSTSELWGNALTDTWVNDADFGVAIGIMSDSGQNSNVFIDYIQVTVEYSIGGGESRRRLL